MSRSHSHKGVSVTYKHGSWHVIYTDPATGRQRWQKAGATREAAETLARTVARRLAANQNVAPSGTLVSVVWQKWMAENAPALKASTVGDYRSMYNKHFEPAFGNLRIRDLTREKVVAFRNRLRDEGLGVKRVNNLVAVLKTFLKWANLAGYIAADISGDIKLLPTTKPIRKYLTFSEYESLRDALGEPYSHYLTFAVYSGLRAGEQWALRWADVSFSRSEIYVRQAWSRDVLGDVKGTYQRTIGMPLPLRESLEAWHADCPASEGDWVFPHPATGKRLCHANFTKRVFKPAVKAVSTIPDDFSWHELRHTAAAFLIDAGADLLEVGVWLGHSQWDTTKQYAHLIKGHHGTAHRLDNYSGGKSTDDRKAG